MQDRRSRAESDDPAEDYELRAVFVDGDGGQTECTLYPRHTDADELVTHWITAREGSFVDLRSMR